MLVASVQMPVIEGDKPAAIARTVELISRLPPVDLIILPETWNIGFFSFDLYHQQAEDEQGPTLTAMRQAAREAGAHVHVGSLVERQGGHYYNTSFLLSPQGEVVARYRKVHLFGHNSREPQLLTPGNQAVLARTTLGVLGLATCYDLSFPEFFRHMANGGAEMFLVCSAWPQPHGDAWALLNRVRAMENQCFLLSCNAVGVSAGVALAGHSMMVDPWGRVLAEGDDQPTVLLQELDPAEVARAREMFSVFRDRKPWLNQA